MTEITIERSGKDGHGEYRARLAGSPHIGRLTWVERNGVRIAEHTLVPPEIGNRGVAARLVEVMVEDARQQGFRIEPQCSYVAAAFARHPEWSGLRA